MKKVSNAKPVSLRAALNRRYHALLNGACLHDFEKESMLSSYGVSSSKELSDEQMMEVCDALRSMQQPDTAKPERADTPPDVRRLRSRVITQLESLGVYRNGMGWTGANAFLEQKRVAGKRLSQMTDVEELKALVRKLSAMVKKRQEQLFSHDHQARWN